MMLLKEERDALADWIVDLNQLQLNAFLVTHVGVPLAKIESVYLNMELISVRVILWVSQDPARLVALLSAIAKEYPHHPSMPKLELALGRATGAAARQAQSAPWAAHMAGLVPVVNRAQLRNTLSALVAGGQRTVILVQGLRYSGRSHSWWLIEWVARATGQVRPIKVDAEKLSLHSAFQHIATRLDVTPLAPTRVGATPETIAARYAQAMSDALATKPVANPVWLVFDAVERASSLELRQFICQLTQLVLERNLTGLVIFLLGADRNFGIEDTHRQAELETLTNFTEVELATTATAINATGESPLATTLMDMRLNAMLQTLTCGGEHALRDVARLLVDLREETGA